MTDRTAQSKLEVREVTAELWDDFDKLFSSCGGPKSCWCMVWRASVEEARNSSGTSRKEAMKRRIAEGTPVGLLGYIDHEPVAWCSIAPFETYRRLRKDDEDSERVWSIACFFVRREHRGVGMTKQLLAAAVRHAKEHGAKIVEGYPVEPDSPSYRFMGFVPMFKEAGFSDVGRAGTRRHVMRLPTCSSTQ